MAYPSFIIENTLRQFFHQWNCGLQPTIKLTTHSNGAINISSEVTTIPPRSFSCESERASPNLCKRRKSGRNSRLVRQSKRAQVQNDYCDSSVDKNITHTMVEVAADTSKEIGNSDQTFIEESFIDDGNEMCTESVCQNIYEFGDGVNALLNDLSRSTISEETPQFKILPVVPSELQFLDTKNLPQMSDTLDEKNGLKNVEKNARI